MILLFIYYHIYNTDDIKYVRIRCLVTHSLESRLTIQVSEEISFDVPDEQNKS